MERCNGEMIREQLGSSKNFKDFLDLNSAKQLIMNFLGLFLRFSAVPEQCPETENDSPTSSPREDS